MKPVQNKLRLVLCPMARGCDRNLDGQPCSHAQPHLRWEKCLCDSCHGFFDVQCKETGE